MFSNQFFNVLLLLLEATSLLLFVLEAQIILAQHKCSISQLL